MDVYVVSGTTKEPTEFSNDLEFKRQTSLVLASQSFPSFTTFTAAVRVEGLEYNGNVFHQHVLRASFTKTSSSILKST